jgi:hypothetical protein
MAVLGLTNEVSELVATGKADQLEEVPGIGKNLAETIAGYARNLPPEVLKV